MYQDNVYDIGNISTDKRQYFKTVNGWTLVYFLVYERETYDTSSHKGYTGVITNPQGEVVRVIEFHRKIYAVTLLRKLANENLLSEGDI